MQPMTCPDPELKRRQQKLSHAQQPPVSCCLVVPVHVAGGASDAQLPALGLGPFSFGPGTEHRVFVAVPEGSTWGELVLRAGKHDTPKVRRLEGSPAGVIGGLMAVSVVTCARRRPSNMQTPCNQNARILQLVTESRLPLGCDPLVQALH
eukprot:scaffold3952_cov20-Tisochrysis_lutea.AAC.5